MSGTGVVGVTIRNYLEQFIAPGEVSGNKDLYCGNHLDLIADLGKAIQGLTGINAACDREGPSVMT
jgi:hypothetical protein